MGDYWGVTQVTGVRALQIWIARVVDQYGNVKISDMSSSFRDGLAFCAIIHHFRPNLINYEALRSENILENNKLAFHIAENELGVPSLLDPEDMQRMRVPDKFSIITLCLSSTICSKMKTTHARLSGRS